jgi:triosephosphate isomerase (TIM)
VRRIFIAGNWKMYKTVPEAVNFARELKDQAGQYKKVDILIAPTFTALASVAEVIKGSNVKLGAQNLFWEDQGAFTGEVSALMILSAGCSHVIIGHSERRQYFNETDETVNKRLNKALASGLLPIFCIGETIQQRKAGETEAVIEKQVKQGLLGISTDAMMKITIAYEPVWAIGTGETATPEQAEEMHCFIRKLIQKMYSQEIANQLIIQYGGSVKASNAQELLRQEDIDGALIGGASLELKSFVEIIKIANSL